MGLIEAFRNVTRCYGWSFRCARCVAEPSIVRRGERVTIRIVVRNNGLRIGTIYPITTLAEPYDRSRVVFSSHENADAIQQRALRIVDIPPGLTKECSIDWRVPIDLKPSLYYLKCEIWNAPRAYADDDPIAHKRSYRFHESAWFPALEVTPGVHSKDEAIMPRVFISYAAFSDAHKEWVIALRNELVRHGIDVVLAETDLRSPMEITYFMEQGIRESDAVILVCSNIYVEKANERRGGVGYETVITSKMFAESDPRRRKWIPVLRDNTRPAVERIPTYLGSTMWLDMNGPNWEGRTLGDLIRSIREVAKP
jgi:hypothetical protein